MKRNNRKNSNLKAAKNRIKIYKAETILEDK